MSHTTQTATDHAVIVVVDTTTYVVTIAHIDVDVEIRPPYVSGYSHHEALYGHRVVLRSEADDGTVLYARLECTYQHGRRRGPLTRWQFVLDDAPTLQEALAAPRRDDGRTIWTSLDVWINERVARLR